MSASSPPTLPRAFLHTLPPHHPPPSVAPSTPSPSPPGPVYTRLSNGSHNAPSPTNSRGSFQGVSFLLQIGLTRETVNLDPSDPSLSSVKDLVCSIVDQKVEDSGSSLVRLGLCVLLTKKFPFRKKPQGEHVYSVEWMSSQILHTFELEPYEDSSLQLRAAPHPPARLQLHCVFLGLCLQTEEQLLMYK